MPLLQVYMAWPHFDRPAQSGPGTQVVGSQFVCRGAEAVDGALGFELVPQYSWLGEPF
jgi:hypothetical protein